MKEFLYIEPNLRKIPIIKPKEPLFSKSLEENEEEIVVLDGPIEEYEKMALMIQQKFRSSKIIKAKKDQKNKPKS